MLFGGLQTRAVIAGLLGVVTSPVDPRTTKRRVTMRSATITEAGVNVVTVEDYVPDDERGILPAYVADARTRWQSVTVSEEFDAGPGGYDGETTVPADLDHPLAGQVFPATDGVN